MQQKKTGDKLRKPSAPSNNSAGSSRLTKPSVLSDLQRRGPTPSVTRNQHINLFRPGPDSVKNKRCFNCDKLGHLAKDCPDPKRPRRQRPRWRDRVQALVTELYGSKPADDSTSHDALVEHWQSTVHAFLSSVQWEDFSRQFSGRRSPPPGRICPPAVLHRSIQ